MARKIVRRQRAPEEDERLARLRPEPKDEKESAHSRAGSKSRKPAAAAPKRASRAKAPAGDARKRAHPQGPRLRVALFATCLVDLMRPSVGFAALKLLEDLHCDVVVPTGQTCCGQPAYNSGDRRDARALAKRLIRMFGKYDNVVVPSGSCAGMITKHYPEMFAESRKWRERAEALAAKTFELTDFLSVKLQAKSFDVRFDGIAAYHDSCASLREMNVRAQPRKLLSAVDGLAVRDLPGAEVCCGFGGTFCVKYPEISNRMAGDKLAEILETGADTLLAGDMGCLMNLAGRISREGHNIRVFHIAEMLAGMTDAPGLEAAAEENGPDAAEG